MEKEFTFPQVLESLRRNQGKNFTREGWNGANLKITAQYPDENSKMGVPYIYMNIPTGKANVDGIIYRRSPWVPSFTDMFADDWKEVK